MVTTTGTTTTTPTPASTTNSAVQQLLTSLNTGSGIDTGTLVTSLVQAQFATKTAQLTATNDALTKQISGVATLKSTVTNFSNALDTLAKSGTLQTQPTSSNSAILTATATAGAKLSGLSSSITVNQLAAAQTAVTQAPVDSRTTAIGKGSFTLALGTATYDANGAMTGFTGTGTTKPITITDANSSLDGLAAAINASGIGVTASVVTDATGKAYLSMKGATGTAQAFTLTADSGSDASLAQFNVGAGATGTKLVTRAQNAQLVVDGVAVERASNTVSDLIPGVKLQLAGAVPGTAVRLGATTPTDALSQAVNDFVTTYNEVLKVVTEQTDPATGVLRADPAARSLQRTLQNLTLTKLTGATSGPSTLAEIGVATNRDGTLQVNSATLLTALATSPDAIEAMFIGTPASGGTAAIGLSAALKSLATSAASTTTGLGASTSRYTAQQADITTAQSKLTDQSTAMTTRLTQQFSTMNSRVTAYKATQAFIDQQVKVWTKSS
jgi:flagellar hook-associated protein 2